MPQPSEPERSTPVDFKKGAPSAIRHAAAPPSLSHPEMPVAVLSRRNKFVRASCGTLPELNVLITRRRFLPIAGGALLAPSTAGFEAYARRSAGGRTQSWRHGLSLFGDLK